LTRVASRKVGARFPWPVGSWSALCAGSLLALGCALIDPIDAIPSGQGDTNSATSGTSAATAGAQAGLGESGYGGTTPNSGGSAGAAPAVPRCVVNSDCEADSRCLPDNVCVRLDTGSTGPCSKVLGGEFAHDPNAIFFGAFAPLDEDNIEAKTISAIYEMAAGEFNALGGLRGVSGGPPSPLVVIVCNNSHASTPGALHHLIDVVQVPAVLAAMDPNQLLAGFNDYRDTFFVSAFSGSEELANVSHGRAWTMLGQPADYADIYAALMPHVEAMVHSELIRAGKDREIRVAAVTEAGNAFEQELANAVLPRLTFNRLKAAEQPSNYLGRELTSNSSNLNQVVKDIHGLRPDIVLSFASGAFTAKEGVMTRLDLESWSDKRPVYILSPENAEADAEVAAELFRLRNVDHQEHAGRVLGVGPAGLPSGMTDALNIFALNLSRKYPGTKPDFNNYYDAFYFLVDAIYASPRASFRDGTINASDLARGMRRLTNLGKMKINVGPTGISDVFSTLNNDESEIQLYGTMGAPDFNRDTGMRRESGSLYCFDSTRLEIQKDVISYNRDSDQLEQASHPLCLVNFLAK
jgi:hypothetical protein